MKRYLLLATASILIVAAGCTQNGQDKFSPAEAVDISVATKSAIQERANDFGLHIFKNISNNCESENIILSPLSCAYALSMTSLGANGGTYAEIVNALGLKGTDKQKLGLYYRSMSEALAEADNSVTFETANSVWADKAIKIKNSFAANASEYYDALAQNIDFGDSSSPKVINDWISGKTHGLIQDMIKETSGWNVALINALYFKSAWADKKIVTELIFKNVNGESTIQNAISTYTFNLYEGSEGQFISMDFGEKRNYQFEVFIPKKTESINSIKLHKLTEYRKKAQTIDDGTSFEMPILDIEFEKDLVPTLATMGIKKSFTGDAEFDDLSDIHFCISTILHNAHIILNDKGCESAAATVVAGSTCNIGNEKPKIITADRPFIFSIYEKTTGAILFIGQKVK